MGWEDMKQDKVNEEKQRELLLERQTKFMSLIQRVFGTSDGQELLKILKEDFLMCVVSDPRSEASYGYWREGQNSIIRTFVNGLNNLGSQVEITNPVPKKAEEKIEEKADE